MSGTSARKGRRMFESLRVVLGVASIVALTAVLGACGGESRGAKEPRDWGPLTVGAGDGKGPAMTASLSGRLSIGTECVTVGKPGALQYTVIWQQGITRWDPARKVIIATTEDGTDVELRDGDTVRLTGGQGPKPRGLVAPPRASCPKELFSAHRFVARTS